MIGKSPKRRWGNLPMAKVFFAVKALPWGLGEFASLSTALQFLWTLTQWHLGISLQDLKRSA